MKGDGIQIFRDMLPVGRNRVENLSGDGDVANNSAPQLGGGGGQGTAPPFGSGGGGGGGVDPWQSSVESRLTSLDARAVRIEDKVGTVITDVGKLTTRVDHLPSKGWTVRSLLLLLVAMGTLLAFQGQIQRFIGSGASEAPQTGAAARNS